MDDEIEEGGGNGSGDEVPPKPTALGRFTTLIRSLFVNGKDVDGKKETGDEKKDATDALSVLCKRVKDEVKDEVSKHSYNYLRSECARLNLGGRGKADELRKRLEKFLIDQRFKQQLAEFEQQIKSSYRPETDPEDLCDLSETIKNFKDTYIDI